MSASSASGERRKPVSAMVVAPRLPPSASISMASRVWPLCEMPSATSPGRSSAAAASPECTSFHAHAATPMRCRLNCISSPTRALPLAPKMFTRLAPAMATAARSTSPRSSSAAVSSMARVSAAMICSSTRPSGSPGWISRPMSTVQPADRARPVSAAMPSRRSAYPSNPIARQKRVTVAGEVPLRSASSTMVARAAASGSLITCSATRRSAPVNSSTPVRTRASTPSEATPRTPRRSTPSASATAVPAEVSAS